VSVELNDVGDVILDVAAMRALGGKDRYFLLERLRKAGPATAADVAGEDADLAELAEAGLVTGPDETGRWTAVGRGLFLHIQAAFEKVLEPYVNRPAQVQGGLRKVRILSYFLPESTA